MADSWLADLSRALEDRAQSREELRKKFSEELERVGPVVFVPFEDSPDGHGIGWFRGDVGFVAYLKNSNGYDMLHVGRLEDELLRKLIPHMPAA